MARVSALIFCILLVGIRLRASPEFYQGGVLPQGIYHPFVRFGVISFFTEKFDSNGYLQALDRHDVQLNTAQIQKYSPQNYNLLKSVLDSQAFSNSHPAAALDLGRLDFVGDSTLSYLAPGVAYGLTSKWTIGIAIPAVHYSSQVSLANSGENTTNQVFAQISTQNQNLNPDLANAQRELAAGPAYLFSKQVSQYGYKPITPYETDFLGDIRIASRVELLQNKVYGLYLAQDLNLPTGPQFDPNSLTDLPSFHRFYLESGLVGVMKPSSKLGIGLTLKYKLNIPDQVSLRVPDSADEQLIPQANTELLNRYAGNEVSGQLSQEYSFTDSLGVGSAFEYLIKSQDTYIGNRGQNYDLLSANTAGYAGTLKLKASYSTIEQYKNGSVKVPYEIGYAYSDIVIGENIERQTTNEITAKFFF